MSAMPIDRDKKFHEIAKRFGISAEAAEAKFLDPESALRAILPDAPLSNRIFGTASDHATNKEKRKKRN